MPQPSFAQATARREVCAATVCDPHALPLPDGEGWTSIGSGFAVYGPQLTERLGSAFRDRA